MAVLGQAGTGKSELMKAAIWYAFQHDMASFIGSASFMWKAALMVHKPHCPAQSTHSFFGIPYKKGKKAEREIGSSKRSLDAFHGDIKLLFLEEAGTTGLCHLAVRCMGRLLGRLHQKTTNKHTLYQ